MIVRAPTSAPGTHLRGSSFALPLAVRDNYLGESLASSRHVKRMSEFLGGWRAAGSPQIFWPRLTKEHLRSLWSREVVHAGLERSILHSVIDSGVFSFSAMEVVIL